MSHKRLLLTGGTGEIGAAIKKCFMANGFEVIAPTRQELDLSDPEKVNTYLQTLSKSFTAFIHCAGFNKPKLIEEITQQDFSGTMQINTVSFYQICHFLLRNGLITKPGYILGISSIYGFLSRRGRFSYAASKHGLNGMVKSLAIELGPDDIKVNALSPGFVDTKMTRQNNSTEIIEGFKQKIPLRRLAQPDDIAKAALFLCSTDNQFITGQDIIADGGYSIGGFEQ